MINRHRGILLIFALIVAVGILPTVSTKILADDADQHNSWTHITTLPDKAGDYILDKDITVSDTWTVPAGEVNLCLNGKKIQTSNNIDIISIPKGSILNLYDENGGKIQHTDQHNGSGIIVSGTLNAYGGDITNNSYGIYVESGTVTLGAEKRSVYITENGYGIYTGSNSDATITLTNASVNKNSNAGLSINGSDKVVMNGGTIAYNTGGEVVINNSNASLNIEKGTIIGSIISGEEYSPTITIGSETDTDNDTLIMGALSLNKNNEKVRIYEGYYDDNAYNSLKDEHFVVAGKKFVDSDLEGFSKKIEADTTTHAVRTYINGSQYDSKAGTITKDKRSAMVNEKVTLTIQNKETYAFYSLTVTGQTTKQIIPTETTDGVHFTFYMPDEIVEANAVLKEYKKVSFDLIHGTTSYNRSYAFPGDTVEFTLTPETNEYSLCYIIPENAELSEKDGVYSFTMPENDVKFTGAFMKKTHKHADGKEFFEWDQDYLPLGGGSYALTKDVSINKRDAYDANGDLDLCLNGHTINAERAIMVNETFSLYDCKGNGVIEGNGSLLAVSVDHGTFNMYGGTIENFQNGVSSGGGSVTHIYRGTISADNAIDMSSGGKLTIGTESDEETEQYINGRVPTRLNLSDISLYSGYYDERSYRNLTYYEDHSFVAQENEDFIPSGRSDSYKYMIADKTAYKKITIAETVNGTVSCEQETAIKGTTVKLTVEPKDGYETDTLIVKDSKENELTVTDNSFIMPASDVTVSATFKPVTYTIEYDLAGGSISGENPKEYNVNSEDITLENPTKANYVFLGWTGTDYPNPRTKVTIPNGSTGNRGYTANWEKEKYEVTFYDEDGKTVLQKSKFEYGTVPVYSGSTPSKAATDQYTYTFAGWNPELTEVTKDTTYKATYSQTTNKYKITFVDDDGTVLKETAEYGYGTEAENIVKPEDPKKDPTAQYTYSFAGWDPAISEVTGDVTYKAKYNQTVNKYTIIWANYDEKVLETDVDVEYGSTPSYNGETPVKPAEGEKTYTFAGWNPTVSGAVKDQTYTATFVEKDALYNAVWIDDYLDSSKPVTIKELVNKTIADINNSFPADPSTPANLTEDGAKRNTYTFLNWNRTVDPENKTITFKAVFSYQPRKYKIRWIIDDTSVETEAVYGAKVTDTGLSPTRAATDHSTFVFTGWDPDITRAYVNGDKEYTAKFDEVMNRYKITFVDGDDNILETDELAYRETPSYKGAVPQKSPTDEKVYEFSGWDPKISSVTGEQTYKAVFTEKAKKFNVIFKNYDGSELAVSETIYGEIPEYKGDEPTKVVEGSPYTYKFSGWTPELTNVFGPAEYTAVYNEEPKSFKVTFDFNGADYGGLPDLMVEYDTCIPEPEDPVREGYEFAGWYSSDSYNSKWSFDTKIKGEVNLTAQWTVKVEEPDENGNRLEGQNISNTYNDKPLIIKTNNGVIAVPAHYPAQSGVTVEIPEVSNSKDDNVVLLDGDVTKYLDMGITDHIFGIFLDVEYTGTIANNLINEDKKQNYTEVAGSGFTAEFMEIYNDNGDTRHFDYEGAVTLNIDLEKMGISLTEPSADTVRTYYAGHNYTGNSVEYLGLSLSADRKTGKIRTSSLSPFDIVYKDTKRTKPSTPSYIAPKTGN